MMKINYYSAYGVVYMYKLEKYNLCRGDNWDWDGKGCAGYDEDITWDTWEEGKLIYKLLEDFK